MGSIQEIENENTQGKLLVHAIEEKAKWTPQHTWIRYPSSDWETKGYQTITWGQYAESVNKLAYWLDEQLGETDQNDTIAYFGPNDPRYGLLVPAAIKTGRKVLIPDGRVTGEGLEALVAATACKAWVYAEDDVAGPLIEARPGLQTLALPSLTWCLNGSKPDRYPYDRTFDEAAHDDIIIIHTSGTTGIPKPIYHTNGLWTAMGSPPILAQKNWPRGLAHESWLGRAEINCCPPQWLGGLTALILPAFWDTTCIMPPPDVVGLPPDVFKKIVALNHVEGIRSPPHTIHTLYADPESRALLKSLKFILFMGAALDRAVGDDLCQHVRLTPLIGSTETGDQLSLRPASRELWYTHDYVPQNGHRFVASDVVDDLYELVLDRPKHIKASIFQPAFWNPAFNGLNTVETKEMYKPIKDIDGRTRWIFASRKDDLTKLDWLAKFHAQDVESRIQRHPDVQSVLVGGEGRPTPYVIVEVTEGVLSRKSEEQLLDELYAGVIAGSNEANVQEIKIPKETVIIAKQGKPFKRNFKQVVLRKDVERDYMDEIEAAYARL